MDGCIVMERIIVDNLRHLNDSIMALALLMAVSLIIVFEALDDSIVLKYLSITTMVLYVLGLAYIMYRLHEFNKMLDEASGE